MEDHLPDAQPFEALRGGSAPGKGSRGLKSGVWGCF
jgi:hypothetical protein